MKIDYKTRYQVIKDKGRELNLSISSYINKDYFLFFRNSYYSNFREIPLEDYKKICLDKENKGYFPILSQTMEGIEPIQEGEEYHAIGYKITRYLRPENPLIEDENIKKMLKERELSRQYLPLELSFLFNTHQEDTLEDTLTRYIKAVFNTPKSEKEIKKEISKDFNKYALVFSIVYGGGFLVAKKPILNKDFKTLLLNVIQSEKNTLESIKRDIQENRKQVLNSNSDLVAHFPQPYDSEKELSFNIFNTLEAKIKELAKEENTPSDSISYGNLAYEELIKQTPNQEGAIYPLVLTSSEDSYLRVLTTYLNMAISSLKIVREKEIYIQVLESILNDAKLLEDYSYKYLFLVSGEERKPLNTYNPNKIIEKADREITPHFVSTGEPTLEIVKGFQASTSEVSNQEELEKIEQYRRDYRLKEQLENEIKSLKIELSKEQEENGYKTSRGRELQSKIDELAITLNNLDLDKRGNSEYAPFNYFILDNRYRRVDNTALTTYQTTPTDSVIIVNNHTRLFASNSTITSFNALTTGVLVYLIACMVRANSKTFSISNEEIEKFILKENYEKASLKDRDNARNQTFINALDILSKTTIQTQYTPSKTAQRKGIGGRKRGSGSIISYSNTYKDIEITFNKDIYSIAFEDFPIIPLSPRVYDLKPRTFITAYYLHNLYAFNKRETFSISIDRLIDNNISYSGYKKNLKRNPDRLFKPILEDFQEMLEKGIISSYNPTLKDYMFSKIKITIDDLITLTMIMKPQKKKGKQ